MAKQQALIVAEVERVGEQPKGKAGEIQMGAEAGNDKPKKRPQCPHQNREYG